MSAARSLQLSLREHPSEARDAAPHASAVPQPSPVTRALLLRVLAVATAISAFLSLFGPFNAPPRTIAIHLAQTFAYGWAGSILGLLSARLAFRLGLWSRSLIVTGAATGLIMAPPMLLFVWAATSLGAGRALPVGALPTMIWYTVLICVGASVLAVALGRRRVITVASASPAPVRFVERLPLKLRGADIWAVEAEDHYLRLHTSRGQDLILMRLSDAVAELDGLEGAQVHRSWWVAREAIAEARRGDGRATLTLKDGAEVPVSRTYARMLREKNWI